MQRTNVYLGDDQLRSLRALSERRGTPVAQLVREAVDAWLESQGARVLGEDEWSARFDALLARRRDVQRRIKPEPDGVERDVLTTVREVRKARTARRR
jgi:predicted DNA-binding protein